MKSSDEMEHNTSHWYIVHCKHLNEWRAASALQQLYGLTTYVPEVRRRFCGRMQHAPLFPGYLFALINLSEVAFSSVNSTPSVLRLVSFDAQPQVVPAAVIVQIRRRVEELNEHGGLALHNFHPGEVVRISHGPLQGLDAIFLGPMKPTERVHVLIEFLGHHREAEVDVDLLQGIVANATPKQERRTRGNGRVIRRH